jgi:hypothetical protein
MSESSSWCELRMRNMLGRAFYFQDLMIQLPASIRFAKNASRNGGWTKQRIQQTCPSCRYNTTSVDLVKVGIDVVDDIEEWVKRGDESVQYGDEWVRIAERARTTE